MEHEVGAVAFDRDIPHVLDQEGYALVTAVVVRERQELPRPPLRVERVDTFAEENPHVSFRVRLQDFNDNRSVILDIRVECDIYGFH